MLISLSLLILPASKGIFLWTVEPVGLTNDPAVQHIINK